MNKVQVIQVAILNYLYNNKKTNEFSKALKPGFFGQYSKIYNYFLEHGEEPTTELFGYMVEQGLNEEFIGVIDPLYYSANCIHDIKLLIRYYYIDQYKDGAKIQENLDEYTEYYDKASEVGINNESKNYTVSSIYEELAENIVGRQNGMIGYSTGIASLDKYTEGLQRGTVMCLNGYSNIGKSKLSYAICNSILKQGAKIVYISLEVQRKILLGNLLANWFGVGYYEIMKGVYSPDMDTFPTDNIEIVDNKYSMDEIEDYIEKKKPDVVFIDFLQNIRSEGKSEYERMTDIAVRIQQLAIRTNTAILDLSQVSNEGTKYTIGGVIPSKGSGALVASSDVGLVLSGNQGESVISLHIAKNKFGKNGLTIVLQPDFNKGSFEDKGVLSNLSF